MELSTILVAVDFSDESRIALEQALDIARHTGARVVLLHVGVVPQQLDGVPDGIQPMLSEYERILKEYLAEDRRRLADLCAQSSGQGVDVSTMVIEDFPDRGICRAADELAADLVVVGTHGRTGMKRLLLGSVAERVVRLSRQPVLVARPTARPAAGGYRSILVAMDFSPTAEAGLHAAIALAAPGAQIDVVHCSYMPPVAYGHVPPMRAMSALTEPLVEHSRTLGAALVARYTRPGLSLAFHVIEAQPMQGVIEWHDRSSYDLAVVGSRGHHGLRRFLLGSVAEGIVRHASTPVLVVHEPGNFLTVRAAATAPEARI